MAKDRIEEIRALRGAQGAELQKQRETSAMEIRLRARDQQAAKAVDVVVKQGGGDLDPVVMEIGDKSYIIDPKALVRALTMFIRDPGF